ncbi:hypothetical protein PVW46_28315 [Mameliella sp. AT18]|nr:hypothetical protein [Mameliella sp. AT18]
MAEEIEPMMLKYLAQVAGFAPAQAHAYLVSYRKIGLIEQDEETGHYRLGRYALDLGVTRQRAGWRPPRHVPQGTRPYPRGRLRNGRYPTSARHFGLCGAGL